MFEREYENPMTTGDYGEADTPDRQMTCHSCGRVWSGYDFDGDTEWECEDESVAGCEPVTGKGCIICAWEKRMKAQMLAYIKKTERCVDVLSRFLCGQGARAITRTQNARILWDVLLNAQDESVQTWVLDLIEDHIAQNEKQFFVDWILDGGYERVYICAGSENDEQKVQRNEV